MSPLTYYLKQCNQGVINQDEAQLHALQYLENIYNNLLTEKQKRISLISLLRKRKHIRGLYLWGGVGIGKTFLMDCFFQCLPFPEKLRLHFHQFMQFIHKELKVHQGKKDPLKFIAEDLAKKNIVICFDEFVVNDITDAMLLGRLIKLLFSFGVCLVTTSNSMPDDLYKHGLQRGLFLPAIAEIKKHTTVLHINSEIDYRTQRLKNACYFYTPNDEAALMMMENYFSLLSHDAVTSNKPIKICDRQIKIIKQAENIIWFDFNKICSTPRSQHDYLAIAKLYQTVFISNVPVISHYANNTINLFIRLVDVFYDMRIRLILSAEVPIDEIYTEGRMVKEFIRTRSRLHEMQSDEYILRLIKP